MNRHQIREMAMVCLYQYLLLNLDKDTIIFNNNETLNSLSEDEFFLEIFSNAISNHKFLEEKIDEHLVDWKFKRLGYVEQAILLLAVTELFLKDTERAIVIDEAVELAKTYGEEKSYQLINGVLDNIYE